jgi:hypothetical protein
MLKVHEETINVKLAEILARDLGIDKRAERAKSESLIIVVESLKKGSEDRDYAK